jgi:hypothetical protein
MLSIKMKVKKIVFLINICLMIPLSGVFVKHTITSITEQRIFGHDFKHIITSADQTLDQFFVDGHRVDFQRYEDQLLQALAQEHTEKLSRQQRQDRLKIEFAQAMQLEIAVKLINQLVNKIDIALEKIEHPALESFFVFHTHTIVDKDQLCALQNMIDQSQDFIDEKSKAKDMNELSALYDTLQAWPDRLEKFFQDSVQHAIKTCDDTTTLKEFLTLVSQG